VVAEAARLFREQGLDGIGVADLMAAAGLTHGGFYRHFASKEDLVTSAVERALSETIESWRDVAERARAAGQCASTAIVKQYLSDGHAAHTGSGCAIAALGPEIARSTGDVRKRAGEGIELMLDVLTEVLAEEGTAAPRQRAIVLLSTMVGALLLKRLEVGSEADPGVLRVVENALFGDEHYIQA
jgi:TetR/AcrR family transcriptional repressor of nem operon